MKSEFEYLYARRPVLNYVCPPVCEVLFSGSGFPVIVLGDFSSLVSPGGVRFGGYGGFHLSWNRYPGAICYNVYRAETDNPNAPLVIVFECITDTDIPLPPGCYRVSAITPDGETALSPAVCYFVPPMLPPEVTTEAASNIALYAATLNGMINAVGQFSTAYFEWGTTLAYGNTTPVQNMGSTFDNAPFNATISGLMASTLYHYRAIGFNASGEGDGADMTFVTANPSGGIVWDLVWTSNEDLGSPMGAISSTLGPNSFEAAMTQPQLVPEVDQQAEGDYSGAMTYTGPACIAHLKLVVSASNLTPSQGLHRVFVYVDGVEVFSAFDSTNGTYEYNFLIPISINAPVLVTVELSPGDTTHAGSITWHGTLTTL